MRQPFSCMGAYFYIWIPICGILSYRHESENRIVVGHALQMAGRVSPGIRTGDEIIVATMKRFRYKLNYKNTS